MILPGELRIACLPGLLLGSTLVSWLTEQVFSNDARLGWFALNCVMLPLISCLHMLAVLLAWQNTFCLSGACIAIS